MHRCGPVFDSEATGAGSAPAGSRPNYKKTLNLPKTSFSMKANLVQNEPSTLKRWEKTDLAGRIREASGDRDAFVFHDGPPYANGSIHLGHLLNKCMKDFVVRSRQLLGYRCEFVPGWDCHGLPIEHKVMSELVESGKIEKLTSLEEDARRMAIRNECAKSAGKFVKLQAGQMRRLLTHALYDEPYLTMLPEYEGRALETFARICENGLVYRDKKPVHWSPANQTALADAELEYYDRDDLSVYVLFASERPEAVFEAFGLAQGDAAGVDVGFMIWTTTPWTLPANMAVAVHPRVQYSLVRLGDRTAVVASELVEKIAGLGDGVEAEVRATCKGTALVGLRYKHPFNKRDGLAERFPKEIDPAHIESMWSVVDAEYVTTEDGTGLVHTAPGHGADDYNTGKRCGLPIYCPVRENGTYDETVADWIRGKDIFEANEVIAQQLVRDGVMYHQHVFNHSYPHDWRGKTPVIFRATEQWFIGVDRESGATGKTMRRMALEATEGVSFVPGWGKNRLRAMLEQRPDWCISRQRSWGLPIPSFSVEGAGVSFMTPRSVRAVAKVVREEGSDAWWRRSAEQLLRYYSAHDWEADRHDGLLSEFVDESGDLPTRDQMVSRLEKMQDIFDVWYESGVSWASVLEERGIGAPAELYLEGSDQHRGWFQSSLLVGVGASGASPYRTLLTHGFMVDKHGHKMSKSLGNTLEVDELMKDFGADVARWWVSSLAYENDIKVDLEFVRSAGESYRKIRNTLRFMLSNLDDFTPSGEGCEGMCVSTDDIEPTSLEAWVLGELDTLVENVREAYEMYDFKTVHTAIYNFCNETLSAVYLTAVKDRLYCDAPDSTRRRRAQTLLWDLTDALCGLLAPILPHTSDEAYRALLKTDDAKVSVHLCTIPGAFGVARDGSWVAVMDARDAGLLAMEHQRADGVENPLDCGLVLPDPDGVLARFYANDLADLIGVSRIEIDKSASEVRVIDLRDEPRCERSWKRDGTVRERSDGGMLCDRCAEAVGVA
ncbi:MAG: isoleucine--tRNA ligase [Phycisphaerales bacterium JB043]